MGRNLSLHLGHSLAPHQLFNYATALLVDPQLLLRALDGVVADTSTADSAGVPAEFREDIMANIRDQELGLLHVDTEPLTSHAGLPWPELGHTLLLGVCNQHQDISIEKPPRHTSAELTSFADVGIVGYGES